MADDLDPDEKTKSDDVQVDESHSSLDKKSSSIFKSAFKKLSKQRVKGATAASAFFARKSEGPKDPSDLTPGRVKQKAAQLPPVWNQAPPPAPSNL